MKSDVIVVGSSIAGCTAALLYARENLTVTMVEKKLSDDNYKRLCTHFIQPSALPVIKRLGLDQVIENAGGLPNKADIWTSGGWIRSDNPYSSDIFQAHGYNIERKILDPLLKDIIRNNSRIQYLAGYTVMDVLRASDDLNCVKGIICKDLSGEAVELEANFVLAADGRFSTMATILKNHVSQVENNRFACFAYFENVSLKSGLHSQFWMLNPNMAFAYPLAAGKTLICLFIQKSEWESWKNKISDKFFSLVNELPDGPSMSCARQVSSIYKMMDMPNIYRHTHVSRVGFIGDAALSLDPMSGVGCAFAFQSAEWIVDFTIPALAGEKSISAALNEFDSFYREKLYPHAAAICADSAAEVESPEKKAFFEYVRNDNELTDAYLALSGRIISPKMFQSLYVRKKIRTNIKTIAGN